MSEHQHSHAVSGEADKRWLTVALALIIGFMAVEVVVGIIAGSLALISDAAHMLTDAAAIVLALVAIRLAARPAKGSFTYGLKRAEILSAQANGLSLILLAAWLGYEAIHRLIEAPAVDGRLVVITGLAGIAVNIAAAWAMSKANRSSLNVEGAYQHILNDLFAFIATTIAGLIVWTTGYARADTVASLVVVVLMLLAGWRLLRDSGRILLEAAPAGLSPDVVAHRLLDVRDVIEVHDLHLWLITSGQPAISAHVLVKEETDCHHIRVILEDLLKRDYHITHATLQVDHASEHETAAVGEKHCAEPHGAFHRHGV
ncbi:putative cation transporter [Rhizocola hellebori]|uniref:Putative cation transporter n=1 Tax=Rhizocola hellebori TaxID=1392758 RepID=A0A8J3QH82_9ACTN|nr:cation diffusion facilitator family transporter [Rhizocola hellebori]GIH10576.1 putative cation transporter [Rhizocola hellebori]